MSIATIHSLLEDAVAAITTIPTLQRANTRNDTTKPFTRFTLIPSETAAETVGLNGKNRWQGIAQVDVFVPVDSGTATVLGYADDIIEAFPRSLVLTSGAISVQTEMASVLTQGIINKFWTLSVQIRWRALIAA